MTRSDRIPWVVLLFAAVVLLYACRSGGPTEGRHIPRIQTRHLPPPTRHVEIPQLSNCTAVDDRLLSLNADAPLVLLVHGCTGSAGDFYTLADVFAFHGQQTVCFNYNDRDSLRVSTAQLTQAITALAEHLNRPDITLIGHSQGGLIARKALGAAQDDPSGSQPPVRFRLVTIAAPFAGIEAARHCGSTTLAVLTLGLTIPICKMVSGDKWYEITYASDFIRYPGRLAPEVYAYLKVDTDERDSCRRFDHQGRCREDDFVFSLAEQYHQAIDTDELVNKVEMKAGHVKVIGDADSAPVKLIIALQAEGIMVDTPPEDRETLALLLRDLYHQP